MATKRKYNPAHVYKLWVDTNNKCPMCNQALITLKDPTTKNNLDKQHQGEVAHIISLNELKYKSKVLIRSNKKLYKKNVVDQKYYDKKLGKYKESYLNSYNNLLVLCSDCHKKVDGKNVINIKGTILEKDDEEQIIELQKYKEYNLDIVYDESKIPPITIRSKSEWKNAFFLIENISKKFNLKSSNFKIDSFSFDSLEMNGFYDFFQLLEGSGNWKTKHERFFENSSINKFFENNKINVLFSGVEQRNVIFCAEPGNKNQIQKDEVKGRKTLLRNIKSIKLEKSDWIMNGPSDNPSFKTKPEYLLIKKLLMDPLRDFANEKTSSFKSMSIAYMARWGTGKTSIIRSVTDELKEFFNVVEINLWHISNSLGDEKEDNSFVRQIVKETVTQLSNDSDLVDKYMNSTRNSLKRENEFDVKRKMLDSLIDFPKDTKPEILIQERAKFIDQHISLISRVTQSIFNTTLKPTIFVFDDIDRVEEDKKVVSILDSLVAFLSLKNSIYIIPMDEAKVMKSISSIKIGKDSYSYMNKYFTYSIRAPFIPRLNSLNNIQNIMNENKLEEKKSWLLLASQLLPVTYRGIKDYLNSYNACKKILENNIFFNNLLTDAKINDNSIDKERNNYILFSSIIQIKFPLMTDYLSEDIKRKDDLFIINKIDDKTTFLEELINSLRNENQIKNIKLPIDNVAFWRSLTDVEIAEKEYENLDDLSKAIDESIKNISKDNAKTKEFKKIIIDKLTYMVKLFETFNIKKINSAGKLLIWTALTLAEISDFEAMKFAKNIDFKRVLISNKFEDNLLDMLGGDDE